MKHNLDMNGGYCQIKLSNKGTHHSFRIHRLIALHYIPNPNNYPCVDHINRIKTDNRIENLRWASYEMNMQNKGRAKKSGHKYISYYKRTGNWVFQKKYNKTVRILNGFPSKIDCICYKYIILLKVKAGLYKKNSFGNEV